MAEQSPAFVNAEEAAARIGGGTTPRAVKFWREQGGGPPWVRVGKRVLYPVDLLDKFIQDLRDRATAGV
jgi:hypothetical protein